MKREIKERTEATPILDISTVQIYLPVLSLKNCQSKKKRNYACTFFIKKDNLHKEI